MLRMLQSRHPSLFVIWITFSNLSAIAMIALLLAYGMVRYYSVDGPVVETSDVQLHPPRIPVGGIMTYTLWRKSFESCPGVITTAFEPLDASNRAHGVFSVRRPLSTPGYNSPPRLPLNVQTPALAPGRWKVRGALDSRCPGRHKTDPLFEFVIEVYANERTEYSAGVVGRRAL